MAGDVIEVDNEEPEKQLIRGKTATTVEVASTKVERTTNVVAATVTGRTPWDAVVDMGTLLGRLTPWVIIVAGALYGVYKFTTLTQDAQKDANKKLMDTYEEIDKMHVNQMGNLKSMFDLQKTIEERAKAKAQEADEAQKNGEKAKAEAEDARRAAAKANADAIANILSAEKRNNDINVRVNNRLKYLADKENEQSRKANTYDQQVQYLKALKRRLVELANLVHTRDSSAGAKAETILNEASVEAKNSLSTYAREFGKDKKKDNANADALNELVGSGAETFESDLTKEKGFGFSFWQKYHNALQTTYIGVVRQTGSTADGVVMISTEGDSQSKEKVSDVEIFGQLVSVAGRDPDNWNKPIAYNLYLRPTGQLGIDAFTPNTGYWTIPETETDFKERDDKEAKHETIFGSETPMAFMSLDDFEKTEIYGVAKASYRGAFSNMLGMLESETRFDPKKTAEAVSMQAEIGAAFVQLLAEAHRESLKRPPIESASMIASGSDLKPEVYGRIAAVALMNNFKVENIQPTQSSSASPAKDLTCVILCGYSTFDEAPIKRHARLTFTRESTDGKWTLLNFENPVTLSSAKAE